MAKKAAQEGRKRSASARQKAAIKKIPVSLWKMPVAKDNFLFFGIAIGAMILGYALMATGITSDPEKHLETWNNPMAVSVAPLVLVIAYCVLFPLAIMRRAKSTEGDEQAP